MTASAQPDPHPDSPLQGPAETPEQPTHPGRDGRENEEDPPSEPNPDS